MDRPGISPEEQDPTLQGLYHVFAELLIGKGQELPDEDQTSFVEKTFFIISLVGEQLGENPRQFQSVFAGFTPEYTDEHGTPHADSLCVVVELDKTSELTFLLSQEANNVTMKVRDTSFLAGNTARDSDKDEIGGDTNLLRDAFTTLSSALE